jgi:hypothetical protein
MVVVLVAFGRPVWAEDADNDGVEDADDACPGTIIPEGGADEGVTPLALCAHG